MHVHGEDKRERRWSWQHFERLPRSSSSRSGKVHTWCMCLLMRSFARGWFFERHALLLIGWHVFIRFLLKAIFVTILPPSDSAPHSMSGCCDTQIKSSLPNRHHSANIGTNPNTGTSPPLKNNMADAHPLNIYNHVNLASRATFPEADVFMQQFSELSINVKQSILDDGKSAQIRYFHHSTQRWYRATITLAELEEDPTRCWLQTLADIFPWAVLEEGGEGELSGRLLGVSGRVDGLQGCDLGNKANMLGNRSLKAADDLALVLCQPNGPFGDLGKLPKELRCEVYKYAFPRTFWQCYHTKRPGVTLLGMTHSSRLPGILSASKAIRDEVLESAYYDRSLSVIIGTEVIAFNFPLLPTLQAGQTLDSTQARFPKSAELFIGIQIPSPRSPVDAVLRDNIARIVALLNSIALNQSLPPIRVSFKTNQETRNVEYYTSDFGALLGPLADLRVDKGSSDVKSKKPLVIDRLPPYNPGDGRDGFCDTIEQSVRGTVLRFRRSSF